MTFLSRSAFEKNKKGHINYSKWGYIFLIPFFAAFLIFQLIPLGQTFVYSFQTYYQDMLDQVGPTFCGFENYAYLFSHTTIRSFSFFGIPLGGEVVMNDLLYYSLNTLIIWLIGFLPQIIVSLLLGIWFTDSRLNLKGQRFWKTVIYLPNLIMAAALGMLFFMIFARSGPVMSILVQWGWLKEGYDVSTSSTWTRILIAFMNFLMWFGNTTLLLLAGIMGIDDSIYEAALLDGASSAKVFWKITMPLLKPIFIYVVITSMIGGIQLFDVAQIFTQGSGGPNSASFTVMMYLYNLIHVKTNYGQASALSVLMFIITAVLSMMVYRTSNPKSNPEKEMKKAQQKRFKEYAICPATMAEMQKSQSQEVR